MTPRLDLGARFDARRAWSALFVPSGALCFVLGIGGAVASPFAVRDGADALAASVALACAGTTVWGVAYVFGHLGLEACAWLETPARGVLAVARRSCEAAP